MSLRRIVITGGPGGGKTSLWREIAHQHAQALQAVPEVATPLLQHLFPQIRNPHERAAVQHAIFRVQQQLESVFEARGAPGHVLLCDRGTPDGAGYWPQDPAAFFAAMQTSWDAELARYDAVLFLETAAAGGLSIAHGNAARGEDLQTAVAIDRRLHQVWSRHPRFQHVAYEIDFAVKLARGRDALSSWL